MACLPTTLSADMMVEVLAALHGLFQESPLQLHTRSDPKDFWAALAETAPHLLLLDLDMPEIGGLDLCRLLRADACWQALPVLTRITNRLDRVRLFREVAETDPLTKLANRRKFETEVERLRAMSARYHQPLSFAILDLDRFKLVNDEHGHPMGDRVLVGLADLLSATFRSEDVIARWGGEEFAVAMYGMSRDDGVARVASARDAFGSLRFPTPDGPPRRVTFSGGVAQFDLDGSDLHEVYRKANEALFIAKEAGRERVLPYGWRADPPFTP